MIACVASIVMAVMTWGQTSAPNYVDRTSPIELNGVCGMPDNVAQKLYFSLPEQTASSFVAIFTAPEGYTLVFDGQQVISTVEIADWQRNDQRHQLVVTDADGRQTAWTLVFTTLPIINIDVNESALWQLRKTDTYAKLPAYMHLVDAERRTGGSALYHHYIAMRVRGATSAGREKKPYSIELRDAETNEEADTALLGMRRDGDWVLDAAFCDHSRMRNRVVMDVWREMDPLPYATDNEYQYNSTEGHFVEVMLNGRYNGLYCLSDKVDRKKLNLKKTSVAADGTIKPRGLLWKGRIKPAAGKGSAGSLGSYNADTPTDSIYWEGLTQEFPDDPALLRWDVVKQFIDVGNFNVNKSRYDETTYYQLFADEGPTWFYLDNLVHYCMLLNAFYLRDNIGKNYYISIRNINSGHQMLFTPWDTDVSFGRSVGGASTADDAKQYAFGTDMGSQSPIARMLSSYSKYSVVDELRFRQRLYEEWKRLSQTILSVDSVMSRIERYATLLMHSGAYQREYDRWHAVLDRDGEYKKMDEDLFVEVEFMRQWYSRNFGVMDEYIRNLYDSKAEISEEGEERYRIVSTQFKTGSIAIGNLHGVADDVTYIKDNLQLSADCWWYVDINTHGQWRLRNAQTNQCLMASTKVKLLPAVDYAADEWWTFDHAAPLYQFGVSSQWLKLNTITMGLETSKYSTNTQFYLVDEDGTEYYPDDVINGILPPVAFGKGAETSAANTYIYNVWGMPASSSVRGLIIKDCKKVMRR